MIPLWYMSFSDDSGFLGVIIAAAPTFEAALMISHLSGLNPGGEVLSAQIPDEERELWQSMQGRLIGREELYERGCKSVREWERELA